MIESMGRQVRARYQDPLGLIWMATARRLGLEVRRNPTVFAATNGRGLLELGPPETLDADDCDAQMIFHELCHWVTNGLDSVHVPDWGCAPEGEEIWREQACLRLQAALAGRHGLRDVLAPTTVHRLYYDALGEDALRPVDGYPDEALAVGLAREALGRADGEPWAAPLTEALAATARIAETVRPFLSGDGAKGPGDTPEAALPSLWASARSGPVAG